MQGLVNLHPAKSDALFSRGENMIYRSQEPLRILGDLSDDVVITVMKITKEEESQSISDVFNSLKRCEEPLKPGDECFIFMQPGYFYIKAHEKNKVY